jgi:pimeloyl-ACP methyl ester carboxylesterase
MSTTPNYPIERNKFAINGLRLNCLDYGGAGKPAMLFIHGGSAHANWWDFVAPAFADRYHVLALDQRGHGESEWSGEWAYGSTHYAADIDALLDMWKFGAPILIGHSMGAHNVLVYASQHPEKLRAMAVFDAPPDYSAQSIAYLRSYADRPARRFATLDEAVASFKVLPRETMARREVLAHVARLSYKQLDDGSWTHKLDRRTLIRRPVDVLGALGQITCPALLVKIVRSPLLTNEQARAMTAAMPHGELEFLEDSYHHAMLDNPAGTIEILNRFAARIS